jgi:hypothetical protein
MTHGKPAAVAVMVGGLTAIAVALGVGSADAVTAPQDLGPSTFAPGLPVPLPAVGPLVGAELPATPPDLGFTNEGGQQVLRGATGFVCNSQGVVCPWNAS